MSNIEQNRIKVSLPLVAVYSFILFLLNICISNSQSDAGGYSSSYLLRNIGARSIGMAGAYTAVANEPGGIYYNPAGLGYLNDYPIFNSTVSVLGLGRVQSSIAWGQEVAPYFGLGASFNSFYGGSFTARDIRGNPIGEMSDFQYALAMGASYRIEFMSMGAAVKYLYSSLNSSPLSAGGVALDVGTKFDVFDLFSFGLSVQNISGMMFWNNELDTREDIPYTIRAGIAIEFGLNDETYTTRSTVTGEKEEIIIPATRYVLLASDIVYTQYQTSPELIIGIEASLHELIALRGGLSVYGDKFGEPQLFPMNHWGGGISLRPDLKDLPFKMNLDYSMSNEYITSNGLSHHITLMFQF